MKPIPSPPDEEIIALLKRLGALKAEYPQELFAARRAAFVAQIEQHSDVGVNQEQFPSQNLMIRLLEGLKPIVAEYPQELLSARRAAFIAQIEQHNQVYAQEGLSSDDQVIELLGSLEPAAVEYPSELLSARRAAFIAQIQQYNKRFELQQELPPAQNGRIFRLLERLKSIEIEYPRPLWNARRTAVIAQMREGKISVLDALRSSLRNLFGGNRKATFVPALGFGRTSAIIATLLAAAFMGSLAYQNRYPLTDLVNPSPAQQELPQPTQMVASTATAEVAKVICKPGYVPPLCLAREFDKSRDLTFPGNGSARPAVAKDTIPGYSRVHQAAYVNDGLYGPGASWISNSAYSWIKIDLGKAREINTITFGRDRLGKFNDGDPGQFVVAVALSDNVYADGNSSKDLMEYTEVYDSEDAGFDGIVSGPETVKATFDPITARYVKITFENAKTAVDEIEVFMIQPPSVASVSTQRPKDTSVPPTFTPVPTNTLVPSKTPTRVPTKTPIPTNTATPRPTFTPYPTNTEVPTDTPLPPPTATPVPPTNTPLPPPTATPVPPTNPPPPPPTNTPEPVIFTPAPQLANTETPEGFAP